MLIALTASIVSDLHASIACFLVALYFIFKVRTHSVYVSFPLD